jgi:predicted transcriptional regulator
MLMLNHRNDRRDLEKIEVMISQLTAMRRDILAEDRSELRSFNSIGDIARHYLRLRRVRDAQLPDMFQDPAWDILLDLFAASADGRSISISSACIASAAPPTTALRYIERLNRAGLLSRHAAPNDRRCVFLSLTERGEQLIHNFLSGLTAPTNALSALPQSS